MGCKRCGVIGGHDDWCFEESISERDVVIARLESLEEHTAMACHQENVELKEKLATVEKERDALKEHAENVAWSCGRYFDTQDGVWPDLVERLDALKTSAKHHIERFYKFRALKGEKT